jgi:cholesterol transport system auxiliary component
MSKFLLDRRAVLVAGASSLALAACSNVIGPGESPTIYLLRSEHPTSSPGRKVNWQLLVLEPNAAQSLDTSRIALVKPGEELDYYAGSAWQDRLPYCVENAIIEAFEQNERIMAVGRDTDLLKSDYLLQTDIRDFQARYEVADAPPNARVRISAKLIAARTRLITQIDTFEHLLPASQNSVPAVTAALNQCMAVVISQIVDWTLAAPPPPARTE